MSLHLTAKHLAAQGRGPDTTLVHMAPKEVASLQALAQQHGGSLTVNPHTGLPEAGFLESLLPMALGAGAMMLPGMQGVGAGWIGAGIGALEGLRTGSLSKGLMAGLGAYGGAGMAGGLWGSGVMVGDKAAEAEMNQLQLAQTNAANKALTAEAQQAAALRAEELSKSIAQRQAEALANQSSKSFMENLSSNFTTAGKGLTGGWNNFSNSVGLTPGAIGLKTATAAALAPAVMGAYEDSKQGVPAQKTSDSDRGEYAKSGAEFHPNWVGPYESRVPGGEYTYARPYYGAEGGSVGMAEGGVTGMAEGGTPYHNVYQEYMDYLNNTFPPATKETAISKPFQYTTPAPAASAPVEPLPFLETPVPSNTRGGGMSQEQRDEKNDPGAWSNQTDSQKARFYAYHPIMGDITQTGLQGIRYSSIGLIPRFFGNEDFDKRLDKEIDIAKGYDPANVTPVMEGYTRVSPPDPFRLTVKEADTLSNETSNAKIARIIAEAQAAANGLPAPSFVPTPRITAAPEGTVGSAPPQGDPAQMAQAAEAAKAARIAAFDAGREHQGGGGGTGGNWGAGGNWGGNSLSRDTGGESGGAGAAGGLSTPYGFQRMAHGGIADLHQYNLGSYSDGGRLLKGPGDGVSDSIPATIGKGQPARLADGEFVIPARIVSEIGNGSTEAGARKLYAMMDRIQSSRQKTIGKGKVAVNSRADRYLPA